MFVGEWSVKLDKPKLDEQKIVIKMQYYRLSLE